MRDIHLILSALLIVLFGVMGAWYFESAHVFARSGALICGVAALFVVLQAKHEKELNEKEEQINSNPEIADVGRPRSIIVPPTLQKRVHEAIVKLQIEEIEARRLRFVIIVAMVTFFGEAIHGFGDLLYEAAVNLY